MTHDFATLVDTLKSVGVTEQELIELRRAMNDDASHVERHRTIGPKVAGWIGTLIHRASTESWEVSPEAASELLTTEIGGYYGLNKTQAG
ncbi:hypothetical protein [Pararobbsia silviterrae]|uniref:Uncharacterized protein n=1 Tax=Pararobbsia silviterrae TaxID=1792498 RepID=A0A494Y1J4_9BURK|nr:hypothetical protein [Pararobbsia silviterrae]RKP56634.1 hypothetical protein D7S86_09780 [Pararobbsia silviterrae]